MSLVTEHLRVLDGERINNPEVPDYADMMDLPPDLPDDDAVSVGLSANNVEKQEAIPEPVVAVSEPSAPVSNPAPHQAHSGEGVHTSNLSAHTMLSGVIVDHGKANFHFDENERGSYYVKLDRGETAEERYLYVWGVDLPRAIEEAKLRTGDAISLAFGGRQNVKAWIPMKDGAGKVITGKDGKPVKYNEEWVHRNTWLAEKIDPATIPERVANEKFVHDKVAPKKASSGTDAPAGNVGDDSAGAASRGVKAQQKKGDPGFKSSVDAHVDQTAKKQLQQMPPEQVQQRMVAGGGSDGGMLSKLLSAPFTVASAAGSLVAQGVSAVQQKVQHRSDLRHVDAVEPQAFTAGSDLLDSVIALKSNPEVVGVMDELKNKGVHPQLLFHSGWSEFAKPENEALRAKYDAAMQSAGADGVLQKTGAYLTAANAYLDACEKAGERPADGFMDLHDQLSDEVDELALKNKDGERLNIRDWMDELMKKIKSFFDQITSRFRG